MTKRHLLFKNVLACLLLFRFALVAECSTEGFRSLTFRSTKLNRSRGPNVVYTSSSSSTRPVVNDDVHHVTDCAATGSILAILARGAALRVASDLTGGTPLESIKCRVAKTMDGPIDAYKHIVAEGGFANLWAGSTSRAIEGIFLGAFFLLGSNAGKKQVLALGGSKTMASLAGGLVGSVAQSLVVTPAGIVFASLNLNRGNEGFENDNVSIVTKRIYKEKGLAGMYCGTKPMALRQATNWMTRSWCTEVARTTFRMSEFGLLGEIGSGIVGGLASCWNTPVETIRVYLQADVSAGKPAKTFRQYWNDIVEEQGYQGLYCGVTPRGIQAIWQTVFMVTVPNLLGV
mmetsp:Transcript_27503/g.40633  ORF Transcript_27503/g.40633 Transcript_27503/m.40633 type:complete len:345 (+) Transcript_27503:111-1145(+)